MTGTCIRCKKTGAVKSIMHGRIRVCEKCADEILAGALLAYAVNKDVEAKKQKKLATKRAVKV